MNWLGSEARKASVSYLSAKNFMWSVVALSITDVILIFWNGVMVII